MDARSLRDRTMPVLQPSERTESGFRRWIVRLLFALFFACSSAGLAVAAGLPVALVIGNSNYEKLPQNTQAAASALLISSSLRSLGYEVITAQDMTRDAMLRALREFSERAADAPLGLIYFSGYAAHLDGRDILLPVDTDPNLPALGFDSIGVDVVTQSTEGSGPGIVLLDVAAAIPDLGVRADPVAGPARGLAPGDELPSNMIFALTSSSGASDGPPSGPISIFAHEFADAVEQPGADIEHVLRRVALATRAGTNDAQQLTVTSSLLGPVVVNPDLSEAASVPQPSQSPSAPASSEAMEEILWRALIESRDEELLHAFIQRYPSSRYAPLAEMLLRQLEEANRASEQAAAAVEPAAGETQAPEPAKPVEPAVTEDVTRHPFLDAPATATPGIELVVTVGLTEEMMVDGVAVKPGTGSTVTAEGALAMRLAEPENGESWAIDADLIAPGFDAIEGSPLTQRFTLYRDGDSDFLRFRIMARDTANVLQRKLMVRFYQSGAFLGSASRTIAIVPAQAPPVEAAPAASSAMVVEAAPQAMAPTASRVSVGLASNITIAEPARVPDLDMTVHFENPADPRRADVYIHSPRLDGPVHSRFDLPDDMDGWLRSNYLQMVQFGERLRGADALTADATDASPEALRRRVISFAEGFGSELYQRYAPDAFKDVYRTLNADGGTLSIQITSNSPLIPWELMRPESADADGGFLGFTHRVARWAPRETAAQLDRPGDAVQFDGVAMVAPHYSGAANLPFQQAEMDALQKIRGFASEPGDYLSFEKLLKERPRQFIHFSGHGQVSDDAAGEPVFSILLEDEAVDPTTWRRISMSDSRERRPFYFFNACDTGGARVSAGFVRGWGATVLASGASGFIGGMWPLVDRSAAEFAADFYGLLDARIESEPVYVADLLRDVRRKFLETGDPTFLAYTYYGAANLTVSR